MKSVIIISSGGDANKLLIPGKHYLAAGGSHTNLPSIVSGSACEIITEYVTNTALRLRQTLIISGTSNMPIMLMRYITSTSSNPYPSGTFTYGGWYQFANPTLVS